MFGDKRLKGSRFFLHRRRIGRQLPQGAEPGQQFHQLPAAFCKVGACRLLPGTFLPGFGAAPAGFGLCFVLFHLTGVKRLKIHDARSFLL